MRNTRK